MKTNKDFILFQRCFGAYRKLFGLTGYKCYFKYESFNDGFADIVVDQDGKVATVRLNSNCPDKVTPFRDVRGSAKHEALHLLLGRLEGLATDRFTRANEIYEEVESIVFKLEELIPDVRLDR